MAQANIKAVVTAEDRASSTLSGVGTSFGKLTASFAAGQIAAQAFTKALQIVNDTVKKSVGAAFEQVRQVENATFALKAYEKNGAKVNDVLSELVKYARSDLGTLFQRQDLFEAASTLKIYGQATETLVDKVKILSKGVSIGKTSFQELSQIVGRAAAKGRLDAVDFDMLIERGIGLDKSFRGAAVTSEELFEALDKALPAELLEGRANTIDGAFIRLQSAFRDLGSAILGVDAETNKFIEGGLGDRFMSAVKNFRTLLANQNVKDILMGIGSALGNMAQFMSSVIQKMAELFQVYMQHVGPSLKQLWFTIKSELVPALQDLWVQVGPILGPALKDLAIFIALTLVAAIVALTHAIRIIISVISVFIKFVVAVNNDLMRLWNTILGVGRSFWNMTADIRNSLSGIYNTITEPFRRAFDYIVGGVNRVKGSLAQLSPGSIASGIKDRLSFIPGFAPGVRDFGGGLAMVGENGPELVNLPRGADVMPNSRSGAGSNINITVQAGAYMGNRQDARKYAQMIFDNLKDVAQSNGMTVGQMIGQ